MTAALTVLTMPLAAGTAHYGVKNAYFWIVSCLLMYTVALPGYAHDSPMPVLALWRLANTAIGIALELAIALLVFPVTARSVAHATAAAALRGMADVTGLAFRSVLAEGSSAAAGAEGMARRRSGSGRNGGRDGGISREGSSGFGSPRGVGGGDGSSSSIGPGRSVSADLQGALGGGQQLEGRSSVQEQQLQQECSSGSVAPESGLEGSRKQQEQGQPGQEPPPLPQQLRLSQVAHVSLSMPSASGWHGDDVGPVLSLIHQPMMEVRRCWPEAMAANRSLLQR